MTLQIARRSRLPVYECLAVAASRSQAILRRLVNINDDMTDRIPMKLLFFIGMPVMIIRKHPQLLQADVIANGVLGNIVGFAPPAESLGCNITEANDVSIHRLNRQPQLLLVKIRGETRVLVEGFPKGVIGIPPLHAQVRLSKLPNLSQATITVDQFAVVPAFACTTEKLQGQTCRDGIVVSSLDRRKAVPRQALYVALSRCVSLEKLTLTDKLTRDYLKRFQPSNDVSNEMERLMKKITLPPYIQFDEAEAFQQWRQRQMK